MGVSLGLGHIYSKDFDGGEWARLPQPQQGVASREVIVGPMGMHFTYAL